MRTCILFLGLLMLTGYFAVAQIPYSEKLYSVRTEADLFVGSAPDYSGVPTPVRLDLYKPSGDDNCLRPMILMIHGGAWIAGTRKDAEIVALCREMAERGYVAASLEYRLGFHTAEQYTPYAACSLEACVYPADTAEVYRAVHRGVQDVWAALAWLKNRSAQDSTDTDQFFLGGVSAGGFVALQSYLWQEEQDRPDLTKRLADAPKTDPDLDHCSPTSASLDRPDLGSAKSSPAPLSGYPEIRGIANFFGGIFRADQLRLFEGLPIFMYHQTSDLIVGCDRRKLLGPLFEFCIRPLNLCQPQINMPVALGSCGMLSSAEKQGLVIPWLDDIDDNGPAGGWSCLANPPTHSIRLLTLRTQRLADYFGPVISLSGNDPDSNCLKITNNRDFDKNETLSPDCYPNPGHGQWTVRGLTAGEWRYTWRTLTGQTLSTGVLHTKSDGTATIAATPGLAEGLLLLTMQNDAHQFSLRIIHLTE